MSRRPLTFVLIAFALFPLVLLEDSVPFNAQTAYDCARLSFLRGNLAKSQQRAAEGYGRVARVNLYWALRFRILQAEIMMARGMNDSALDLLSSVFAAPIPAESRVEVLTLQAAIYVHTHKMLAADTSLTEAEDLCKQNDYDACGAVSRARGVLALEHGALNHAQSFFSQTLAFARLRHDRWLEATALLNQGVASLQQEHFDESVEQSASAYQIATALDAEDIAQRSLGNLGWAYFGLGDTEKSLKVFQDAESRAASLGDVGFEAKWLTTEGQVYWSVRDFDGAVRSYRRALILARQIDSKDDIVNSLEDLAHLSIETGKIDDAQNYITQLQPLIGDNGNRLDALDVLLAQGKIAAARHIDSDAEKSFREVQRDPSSQTSIRLGAEHQLARLYESEGNAPAADALYKTALATFESERDQILNEVSKLPFLTNAAPIYDDYIHFLVGQGKTGEALAVADRSRARTLAQGLGLGAGSRLAKTGTIQPSEISRRTGATLFFYWLGVRQSWLWTVTPRKTSLYPLPAQAEIARAVERYNRSLQGPIDPLASANQESAELYRMIVAPAKEPAVHGASVMILCDGALSQLNFETLVVPGKTPHYWIEDATITSAPSLYMLSSARAPRDTARTLLLLGNPVSPGTDYPELPRAGVEMTEIEKHFGGASKTVFARESASSSAYVNSTPQRFGYIHFVAHGVANRTDPLDSAIILSRNGGAEDSFKLYAREIVRHPIDARLVTISTCSGSGTRSYAGEGLVGLSWAFLRAGAHNVIAALWEVSDDSTARLMDDLYRGLDEGLAPANALRRAKLDLLHGGVYARPFYWAPFQLYSGM